MFSFAVTGTALGAADHQTMAAMMTLSTMGALLATTSHLHLLGEQGLAPLDQVCFRTRAAHCCCRTAAAVSLLSAPSCMPAQVQQLACMHLLLQTLVVIDEPLCCAVIILQA